MKSNDVFPLWHALHQHPQPRPIIGLAPSALLVLHSLITVANQAHWAHSFTCPDSTLSHLTHLSKQSITEAKRELKNRGLIDYHGSPSEYEILLGNDLGRGLKKSVPSAPPDPLTTPTKEINTKKKKTPSLNKGKERKGSPATATAQSAHSSLRITNYALRISEGGDDGATSRHLETDIRDANDLTSRARNSFK